MPSPRKESLYNDVLRPMAVAIALIPNGLDDFKSINAHKD